MHVFIYVRTTCLPYRRNGRSRVELNQILRHTQNQECSPESNHSESYQVAVILSFPHVLCSKALTNSCPSQSRLVAIRK